MAFILPARTLITYEEVQFRAAVAESTWQKIGGLQNFLAEKEYQEKPFYINGPYNIVATPQTFIDGMTFFQFDATILDAWMFVELNGSGGTTEIDIKYATTPGGSFSSIFSTTPKITSAAGGGVWIHVGSSVSGTTAPVLSTTSMDAGWALRCDLLQAQTGTVSGCGMLITYQPR